MEVKPGYKQTEVGVIPEEWDDPRLDSLGGGRIPPIKAGPFGSSLTKDQYVPEGYKVYGQEQVIAGDHRFGDYFITQKKYRDLESCAVRPGDVLLSLVGTVGKLLEVPEGAPPGIINPRLIRFSFDRERVSSRFFKYVFESGRVQSLLARQAQGGTMGVLNAGVLRPFRIPLPPPPEQRAIAEALSDVDGLLGGLDRLIAKKRDLKQAAMQQLLTGLTRLPGFHGEWETKALGDIATISKGTQLHSSETNPDGHFPHFNGGISPSSYTDKFNTSANTIAISEGGNSCGYVQLVPQPFWCGGHCYAVVPKSADNRFLFHALKGQQAAIQGLRVGSGLPNVQKTALADFELPLPSDRAEQTAIAEVLTEMDLELVGLEQRREKTRALKQAMMQELLTGRTRLA